MAAKVWTKAEREAHLAQVTKIGLENNAETVAVYVGGYHIHAAQGPDNNYGQDTIAIIGGEKKILHHGYDRHLFYESAGKCLAVYRRNYKQNTFRHENPDR